MFNEHFRLLRPKISWQGIQLQTRCQITFHNWRTGFWIWRRECPFPLSAWRPILSRRTRRRGSFAYWQGIKHLRRSQGCSISKGWHQRSDIIRYTYTRDCGLRLLISLNLSQAKKSKVYRHSPSTRARIVKYQGLILICSVSWRHTNQVNCAFLQDQSNFVERLRAVKLEPLALCKHCCLSLQAVVQGN